MRIRMNGALSRWLAGSALGGLIAFAFVPAATAQWLPPWGAAFPGQIERNLEAQGYVLTAPLMRRPGVYLADVSAGPARYERLVIDARSGQILQRFVAPSRVWGPALAARDEGFGRPLPGVGGPPLSGEFPEEPGPVQGRKSAHGGPANIHIPAAISPYDTGEPPAGSKPKPKSVSTERKSPAAKPGAPTFNPPLPPPAPREAAKADGSASPTSGPAANHDPDQPRMDSPPTEVDSGAGPTAAGAADSSVEASDKPKVSIVPPALFQ